MFHDSLIGAYRILLYRISIVAIMPMENLEEQGLAKNPKLELAQLKFLLTNDSNEHKKKHKVNLLEAIKEDSKHFKQLNINSSTG